MDTLMKADIFFFVTTIVVVVSGTLGIVITLYILPILKNIWEITERIKQETHEIADDIDTFRDSIKEKAGTVGSIVDVVGGLFGKRKKKTKQVSK